MELYLSQDTFEFNKLHVTKSQPSTILVLLSENPKVEGGGELPYKGYIGMCSTKGYGFFTILV